MPSRPSIYWAGSYPHNNVSAGINTLLRRYGASFKVAFNRSLINQRVQSLTGGIDFNHEVQVELSDAARQLQNHGFCLYVHHDAGKLNGDLELSLDEHSLSSDRLSIRVDRVPGQAELQPIWTNGLAHRLWRLQRDALSARFNLDYEDVDNALAMRAPELIEAFVLAPKHPVPRLAEANHSWFSILKPADEAAVEIWVPDPTSQRSEAVQLTPSDRHLLTNTFPQAFLVAQQTTHLKLVSIRMKAKTGRPLSFVLPMHQWVELCEAIATTCWLSLQEPRHSGRQQHGPAFARNQSE